jgi:hypothetical protein
LNCDPLSEYDLLQIEKAHKKNSKVAPYKMLKLKVKTDGFIYNLEFRFGEEPIYYSQFHHKHNYDPYIFNNHNMGLEEERKHEEIDPDVPILPPSSGKETSDPHKKHDVSKNNDEDDGDEPEESIKDISDE